MLSQEQWHRVITKAAIEAGQRYQRGMREIADFARARRRDVERAMREMEKAGPKGKKGR